jgi:hypothetical protein
MQTQYEYVNKDIYKLNISIINNNFLYNFQKSILKYFLKK